LFAGGEFRDNRGSKLKRPFMFMASALRGVGAETDADLPLIHYLNRMGHAPFSYPTPDGYPDTAAPWLGTLLWRWNFAVALTENRIKGTKCNLQTVREHASGDDGMMAHLLGRQPTVEEKDAYHASGAGTALILASPAFQLC
jgi:uncharacterized protein (DUF1800 family)